MEESDHGAVMTVGLVAALVGLLVGFGAAAILKVNRPASDGPQNEVSTPPDPTSKAVDLRVEINNVLSESSSLSATAIRAGYDGRQAELAAVRDRLNANSRAVASIISRYSPAASESQIQAAWSAPTSRLIEYTTAIKRNDKSAVDAAVTALNRDNQSLSMLLSSSLPDLPNASVTEHLTLHSGLLKNVADSHHAKDPVKSYEAQYNSYAPLGRLADAITVAVVKQSPDKF